MKNRVKQVFACLLSILIVVVGITPMTNSVVNAETTTGLQFTSIKIVESETGTVVADLLNGETPKLKTGVTYALNVSYSVPLNLQFSNTYLNLRFGDGVYVKTLPGATFTEGPVASTGFESLVKTPTGTGTSPYGYPGAGSEKSRSGDLKYKSKVSLTNVSSVGEICFALDDAYLNQDPNQILSNLFKLSLSTDATNDIDAKSFNAISTETFNYGFWNNQPTEAVSKGHTTSTLNVYNTGGKSLTRAGSKTTVQIVYPSDIELVGLEERGLYNTNGTVVSTTESGGFKTATVEWNEPGSYSGGLSFYPHLKVPANSTRANGSTFDVVIKNFSKTIWNDNPNVGRTSNAQEAKMTVTIMDGSTSERTKGYGLVDTMPNWALKKYDTYNVRLGSFLIKNELPTPTLPKTLEFNIDNADTAIIRGDQL
jgi:putative collagen-binding protein